MTEHAPDRHPRDLIHAALRGFDQAGELFGEGGSDSGPPLYDSTPSGWRLGIETDWNEDVAPRSPLLTYRFFVDHVGARRADALAMYLEALRAAGLEASTAPASGSSKRVVWLAGRYDAEGRRIG